MDFNLSREHQLIRKMIAEFTEREVKPIAAETDRTCEYPRDNIEKLFNLGVMGMCVPKEYGGAGADPLASALCIEELSKQCASTGDIVATHNGLCCDPIMTYGTAEQKAKYLPMLTTGHHVGAFALTEPNAGSDASKGQTEAKLVGDHYVMNGSKIFITNGYVADVFVVFAMTDKSKGTKGISAFIVESGFPGFSVGKHEETVILLSHKKPDGHINVKVEFGEGEGKVPLDNIAKRAESYKPKERVTYKMIKEYIEAKYGFKVHTAYIAEVKRDLGLPMYDAPNAVEELKQPRKHPTVEKVEAIKDALKHFEVI